MAQNQWVDTLWKVYLGNKSSCMQVGLWFDRKWNLALFSSLQLSAHQTHTLLPHLLFSFAILFFFFACVLSQIQMNAAFMARERILAGRRCWEEGQGGEENGIQSSGCAFTWNRPSLLCNCSPAACAVLGAKKWILFLSKSSAVASFCRQDHLQSQYLPGSAMHNSSQL